jgi:hypothetical protein
VNCLTRWRQDDQVADLGRLCECSDPRLGTGVAEPGVQLPGSQEPIITG